MAPQGRHVFLAPGGPPLSLALLYPAVSVLAFVAYAMDKAAARSGLWRIPEAVLHLLGLAGGWPGALIAQRVFRHKCRKISFQITFWLVAALNAAVTLGLLMTGR